MKSKKEIEDKIVKLQAKNASTEEMRESIMGINPQGSAQLAARNVINKTNGEIKSLKWVLDLK